MSGKRILDTLAMLKAGQNVASNHFAIRLSQVELFGKTSSVVKSFRPNRIPSFVSQSFSQASATRDFAEKGPNVKGIQQDSFYQSEQNSAIDPPATTSYNVTQADAQEYPLPDGTIPPANTSIGGKIGDAESEYARQTQGGQISVNQKSTPAEDDEPEFSVEQEQDLFYQPPGESKPVLSARPRVRVPKIENDIQGGDSHLPEDVNADVFYSGSGNEADEPSEEQLSQLFHSPRSAKLLGNKKKYMPGARQFHTSTRMAQRADTEKEELKQLAQDMANDIQSDTTKPYEMRESRVPSSRMGRLFEYGGLAASMAFGAVGESMNRSGGSLLLSPANLERLVAKLSKMRGAALKLGQMISFQDIKMLPQPIIEVLQRVQDSADYMPASQRDQVIEGDLGPEWRNLFQSFEEKPIAAASIGQVHGAILKSGQPVAVKVQYPGVADSISSDLNNLSLLLTASRLLPKGLYLEKTIANARTELAWECDYVREAEAAKRFKQLLCDEEEIFKVPGIIDEASGKQVLTMERMEGVAVTKIKNFTQEQKDWIGTQILRLCLREIVEFKYMQTDPNWTNFLYNKQTNKLELLDFGASRDYPERFVKLYIGVLEAASKNDRNTCRDLSIELGYLTGFESKAMLNAHIDSVMTLAEPFMASAPEVYDFKDQTITDRIRGFIPTMLRERLAPPPEETYSLHRKLSGAFLLCARLGSRVRCKDLFQNAVAKTN